MRIDRFPVKLVYLGKCSSLTEEETLWKQNLEKSGAVILNSKIQ